MKISKALGAVTAFGSNLYWAGVVRAQGKKRDSETSINDFLPKDPLKGEEDVLSIAKRGIELAIFLAALVCVVILVASGYSYITAAGDEQKVEKATKTLTYAIVGLIICFIAVILVQFVMGKLLNVEVTPPTQ